MGVLDLYEGCSSSCVRIYFELCCLVVGKCFPAHPAERFTSAEWEGEGDVDQGVFATECVVERRPSRKYRERTYLGDFIRAVLSWDLCLRGLSGW